METSELDNRFIYHPPTEEKTEKFEEIRKLCMELAHAFNALCPESREKSLAVTNLEQAQFWANASIARYGLTVEKANPK